MKKYLFLLSVLAAFAVVLTSCKKDDDEGTTNLNISIAASYDLKSIATYDEVNINILQLSYHTSGNETIEEGWYDLETTPGIYNLMTLGSTSSLVSMTTGLEPETISQIRMLLGDGNTVVEDGETYELSTPSGQTSGLKVQVHLQMEPEKSYEILLNFDPEESVHKTGNDEYKLEPVIQATVNEL